MAVLHFVSSTASKLNYIIAWYITCRLMLRVFDGQKKVVAHKILEAKMRPAWTPRKHLNDSRFILNEPGVGNVYHYLVRFLRYSGFYL